VVVRGSLVVEKASAKKETAPAPREMRLGAGRAEPSRQLVPAHQRYLDVGEQQIERRAAGPKGF